MNRAAGMADAKTRRGRAEEISAPVAFVAVDSAFHWRCLLGISPSLEAAQPGHNRWSVIFWLVTALCAAAYAFALLR